jgi:hypothetical protein
MKSHLSLTLRLVYTPPSRICRKIISDQNHMLTTSEAKRGRWVYRGGQSEVLDMREILSGSDR